MNSGYETLINCGEYNKNTAQVNLTFFLLDNNG